MQRVLAIQTVSYYEGRKKIAVPLSPMHWHPRGEIVEVLVDIPEDVLNWLIEEAYKWGWGWNPHTRTFYRLD